MDDLTQFSQSHLLPDSPSLIVFDFDGVFTDNKVYVFDDGREAVVCSRADSIGTNRLLNSGLNFFVLSTETNAVVNRRCEKLKIKSYTGCDNKAEFLRDYFSKNRIDVNSVIYVGNDINDLDAMQLVGCPVCPQDAHPEIKTISKIQLKCSGGHGAVRELCDMVLTHCAKNLRIE